MTKARKPKPKPSTNGANGRRPNGQFAKGNDGGPGNPHVKHTATESDKRTGTLAKGLTARKTQETE